MKFPILLIIMTVLSVISLTYSSKYTSILIRGGRKRLSSEESSKPIKSSKSKLSKSFSTKKKLSSAKVILPSKKPSLNDRAQHTISSLNDALKSSADKAISATTLFSRKLKIQLSSNFEKLLLRMTFPNDDIIDSKDIGRYIATISSFTLTKDLRSESNPHRVTLRKIWKKLIEKDARTKLKALYLLHLLLMSSQPEDCRLFRALVDRMKHEWDTKSKTRYFDERLMLIDNSNQKYLEDFIERYTSYVFLRLRSFTSSFEELKCVDVDTKKEELCAQMLKAEDVINHGIACRFKDYEESAASTLCLEAIAKDLVNLLSIYYDKLRWIIHEHELGDVFGGWTDQDAEEVMDHFKVFYHDAYEQIQSFIQETNEVLAVYELSVPYILQPKHQFVKSNHTSYTYEGDRAEALPYNITMQLRSDHFRAFDTSQDYLKEYSTSQHHKQLQGKSKKKSSKLKK